MSADIKKISPHGFTEPELQTFLSSLSVLVVSEQAQTAKTVRKLIVDLGATTQASIACFSFKDAMRELAKSKIHILVTDLYFNDGTGIDLIKKQESAFASRHGIASLIMTQVPSRSDTAVMVEADVDAVMILPITVDNFKAAFFQAMENKVNPSDYWEWVEKGKELLKEENLVDSAKKFEEAMDLKPNEALPHYYLGLVNEKLGDPAKSLQCFHDGLKADPKNYRCLTAIFNHHMLNQQDQLAYEAAAELHQYYPVSAERIADLVKLSMKLKQFEDMSDYYEIFRRMKVRDNEIVKVLIAGMLVCAKYYWTKKEIQQSIEVLMNAQNAALSSGVLLINVLRVMIEGTFYKEADAYFKVLPEAVRNSSEARLLYLEILAGFEDSPGVALYATNLIKDGIQTQRLFKLAIDHSKRMGRSDSSVQSLLEKAKVAFPAENFDE